MSRFGGLRLSNTGDGEATRPAPAAQSPIPSSFNSSTSPEDEQDHAAEDASREMSLDLEEQDEIGEGAPSAVMTELEQQGDIGEDASPAAPRESAEQEGDPGGHVRIGGLRPSITGDAEATRPAMAAPLPILLSSNSPSSSEVESSDAEGASRDAPNGSEDDDVIGGHTRVGGLRPSNNGDIEGTRLAPAAQSPIILSSNSPSSSEVESSDAEAAARDGPAGSEEEGDNNAHPRNSVLRPSTGGDIPVTRLASTAQSPIVLSSNSPSSSDVTSSAASTRAGQQEDDTGGHLRVGGLRPSISGGTAATRQAPAAHAMMVLSSNSPSLSDAGSSAASASVTQELPLETDQGNNTGNDAAAAQILPPSSSGASPEGEVTDSTFELVDGVYREMSAGSSRRQNTSEREDEETTSNTAVAEQASSVARVKGKGPAFPGLSAFDGAPPASTDSVPPPQQSIDDALDKANRALIASDGSWRSSFAFNTGILTPIHWTPAERKAAEDAANNPPLSPVSKALLDRTAAVEAGMFQSAFDTGKRPSVPPLAPGFKRPSVPPLAPGFKRPSVPPLAPGFDETGAAGDVPTSPVPVQTIPISASEDSTLSLPMQDSSEVTVYPPRPAPASAPINSGILSAGLQPPQPPAQEPLRPRYNPNTAPEFLVLKPPASSSGTRDDSAPTQLIPEPVKAHSAISIPVQNFSDATANPSRPPLSSAETSDGDVSAGLHPPQPPAQEPTRPVYNSSCTPPLPNPISPVSSSGSREAGNVLSNANYNQRAQREPDQAAESQFARMQPTWNSSGSAHLSYPSTFPQRNEPEPPMHTPHTTEGYDRMWAALDARMGPPPTPTLSEQMIAAKKIQREMAQAERAERDRIEAQRKENSMRVAAHQRIINEKIRMRNLERSQPPQPNSSIPAERPPNIPYDPFFPFPGDPTLMPPPQPTTLISSSTLLTIPSGPLFPFIHGDPTFPPAPPPSYQVYTANTSPPIAPLSASFAQPSRRGNATTDPSATQVVGEGPTTRRWDITPVRTMALNASAASSSPPAFSGGSGNFTAGPISSPDPGEGSATKKKGRGEGRTKASSTDSAQSEPPASSMQIEHDVVNRRRAKPSSMDKGGYLVGAQVPLQQDSTPLPSQPTVHFPNSGSLQPSGRIIRAGRNVWRETSPVPNPGQPMFIAQKRDRRKKPEVEAAEAGSSAGQSAVASRLPKGKNPPRARGSKYLRTPMTVTGAGDEAAAVSSTQDELVWADQLALPDLPTPEPQSLPFSQAIPGITSPGSRLAVLDGIVTQSKDAAKRLAILAGHEATETGSSSGQPAQANQTAKARESIPYSQVVPGINWQAIFHGMAARERTQVERLAELERHTAIVNRIMSGTNAGPATSVFSAASGQMQPLAGQAGLRPDQALSEAPPQPQGQSSPVYNFVPDQSSARRREKAPVTTTLNIIPRSAPNVPSAGPSRLRNEVVNSPPHLGFVWQQSPPSRQSGASDAASVTTSAAASAAVGS
ncbi:hypothetical protein TI39_contig423g00005 [Zymoseptoria brevis]|uniref:Uncharacterized protein n=1 Tax=Zymoseptoria brevis TaxID=1047168 RepID=A0A0F4GPY0_9PEZI|nr:hypothetical protein TI39_contig423g00005 [Zymoseptoria brevis]